ATRRCFGAAGAPTRAPGAALQVFSPFLPPAPPRHSSQPQETHMSTSATRIRAGAIALAAGGLLFLAYPAVRPWHDEGTIAGATASMSSTAWVTAHFFAMLGFILMPLGLLALRSALAPTRAEPLALT